MEKRVACTFLSILLCLSLLLCRLAFLMSGQDAAATAGAFGARAEKIGINEARGAITDRFGRFLAGGEEQAAALVDPLSLNEESAAALRAHSALTDPAALQERIAAGRPFLAYLDQKTTGAGLINLSALTRYGTLARNLLGYVGSDGHGVCGVEAAADGYLYREGYAYTATVPVDAVRRPLPGLGIELTGSALPVRAGVRLGLDSDIQAICEAAADEAVERGAILVQDLETGDLCACLSRPTYDVSDLAAALNSADSMLNKTLCRYCCGSAFKIVILAAALEAGVDLSEPYECTGAYEAGVNIIHCSKEGGHGMLTLEEAFAKSCNPYFCRLAARVGAEKVLEMAERFGFGQETDLALGIVGSAGNLPALRDLSAEAALANFAIGQGELQVTPLQMLGMAAVIGNGGMTLPPRLWIAYSDGTGRETPFEPAPSERVIAEETAAEILRMMHLSTLSGTGTPAAPKNGSAAVKTASAETGIYENGKQVLHTWVTGVFPAEAPRYAVTVLVEGGVSGYYSAAPVFARVAQEILELDHTE